METQKVTITKIIFSNDETGFKVLNTRTLNGENLIVTGEFGPEITTDLVVFFHGDFYTHPRYGYQFKAASYTIEDDSRELATIRLFLDSIAYRIGIERSKSIIDHFGTQTLNIIENEPERLMEVNGIGKVLTEVIKNAWNENKQKWIEERVIYSIRAFLMSLGLKEWRIKKIINYFSGKNLNIEEHIRKNPYSLIEIEGFGFTTVDFIARKLGIAEDSKERLKAFISYLINIVCLSYGHLFLTRTDIMDLIKSFCKENNTQFLGREINDLDVYNIIHELEKEDKLIYEKDIFVYSKKQYDFEKESASILINIMEEKSDFIYLTREKIEDYIKNFEHDNNMELSKEQKDALYYFAEKKVFVITGLPGTGKTTILKVIVDLALKLRLRLTCMTPTGISAKKLSEVIQYNASTIHRGLGFKGGFWSYNEIDQFDTDVVIIDETSMVDQEVFYRLLSALKKRTHIIFVGDHNQLPSVGAGNVLRELINCGVVPVIRLERIFRQDKASDIIKASHNVIHGNTNLDLFKEDPSSDIFFLRVRDPQEIEKIVVYLASKFKSERREFQIISPRNTGPLGVESLNNILQESLNPPSPDLNEIKMSKFTLRVGDRVIVIKNDYENDIYNGDIGKIISLSSGKALIRIDDKLVDLPIEDIDERIKLAYSITVHKCQGLEYDTIILVFINQHGRNMLQRNLLYTALTRAKKKVIVIGHGSAIEYAIKNTSVIKRNTLLGERIKECLNHKRYPSLCRLPKEQEVFQSVL